MSGKRLAQYHIDPKTLQETSIQNHKEESQPQLDPKEHSERIIVTVKKDHEGESVSKEISSQEHPQNEKGEINKEQSIPQKQEQKQIAKPLSGFQNLFKANPLNGGIGLFAKGASGLFTSNASINPSIFGESKIDFTSNNLFTSNGSLSTLKGGLFSSSTEKKVFDFENNVPPISKTNSAGSLFGNDNEDDEGDSAAEAEFQRVQVMEIDQSKSKGKFEYKEETKVLFSGKAHKYKKNNGDLVESVEVIIQKDEKSLLNILIVRLSATKHNIFTGFLLKSASSIRTINNKKENVEVSAFLIQKNKPLEKCQLKLQFQNEIIGAQFLEKVAQVISQQKNQQKDKKEEEKAQRQNGEGKKDEAGQKA